MIQKAAIYTTIATIGLGFMGDAKQTAASLLSIVTIRGLAFVSVKITDEIDSKMSQIIDFTAWCLCVTAIITIIHIGFTTITPFIELMTKVIAGFNKVIKFLAKIA